MKNDTNSIIDLLTELVAIPSITGYAENAMPEFLINKLSQWEYFKKNPQNMWLEPLKDDTLNRVNFCALVRAVPATKRTVILISHHDVVPVDVCRGVPASPFEPGKYTQALKTYAIDDESREDLESGEWLFGRGVSDMKGGMAAQINLLAEYASSPDKLEANIMLMTLADEENNGFGVHQAARMLAKMQQEKQLDFIVCIDSEPTISSGEKHNGCIYTGSIGNATLFAMCVGRASHVGEYFLGINSTLTASQLITEIEGDPKSSDVWMGKHYPPHTCLKLQNISDGYSVTLPERTAVLFNVLMVTRTPGELMTYFNSKAEKAMNNALNILNIRRKALQIPVLNDTAKIITYPELFTITEEWNPGLDLIREQQRFLDTLPANADSQDRGIALANHMLNLSGLEGPFVLTGLLSPYCQPRLNLRKSNRELAILDAVKTVILRAKEKHRHIILQEEVYEGISDMSEMGWQGTTTDVETLTGNLVGWGTDLKHPFKEMQVLDIPVINLGPVGKDAHKLTERIHIGFLIDILPDLLKTLVKNIAACK